MDTFHRCALKRLPAPGWPWAAKCVWGWARADDVTYCPMFLVKKTEVQERRPVGRWCGRAAVDLGNSERFAGVALMVPCESQPQVGKVAEVSDVPEREFRRSADFTKSTIPFGCRGRYEDLPIRF